MAGALRKTMVYLGLAEDEGRYYDEAYDEYDHEAAAYEPEETPETRERSAEVTPLPNRRSVAQVVRSPEASGISRITTIHPRTYNEAKTIGENFRDGTPDIMNLTDMDDADAKRLVDFAAGLVFGLHGAIERVTAKVFLLSPSTVEVHAEESAAIPGRTLFNQS
jgi:cell division inhibitor SepF